MTAATGLARRFLEDGLGRDIHVVEQLYAPDAVLHTPVEDLQGRAAAAAYHRRDWVALGGPSVDVVTLLEDGDRCFARWTLRGRHLGMFHGFPGTDKPATLDEVAVLHFDAELIKEAWITPDVMGMLAQVGHLEGPPPRFLAKLMALRAKGRPRGR